MSTDLHDWEIIDNSSFDVTNETAKKAFVTNETVEVPQETVAAAAATTAAVTTKANTGVNIATVVLSAYMLFLALMSTLVALENTNTIHSLPVVQPLEFNQKRLPEKIPLLQTRVATIARVATVARVARVARVIGSNRTELVALNLPQHNNNNKNLSLSRYGALSPRPKATTSLLSSCVRFPLLCPPETKPTDNTRFVVPMFSFVASKKNSSMCHDLVQMHCKSKASSSMALSIPAIKTLTMTTPTATTKSMAKRSNAGFNLEMILSKHWSFKKSQSTTAAPKLNYISEFNTMLHPNEGQCNPPSRIVVQNLFDVATHDANNIQNKQSKALVKIKSMLVLMKVEEEIEEQKDKTYSKA